MARPAFNAGWTRLVPPPIERATFVMMTNLVLVILFLGWHPMTAPVWTVENSAGAAVLWGLFGLQQAWFAFRVRIPTIPRRDTDMITRIVPI